MVATYMETLTKNQVLKLGLVRLWKPAEDGYILKVSSQKNNPTSSLQATPPELPHNKYTSVQKTATQLLWVYA